ncbi:transcriptional regulator GcvA [Ferrovibrio sp.]|uniref:transcriptional regulator GcvA n=1 Tax=Ferrovibrio sp. TaxID=1917215 RepID=UPI0025BB87FE|nr:transcriptional regulator GcvA [Ferrovibrio sp.]MBX3453926.1 transcriptional regulator GcvA [Ferrovibrio sp.]
MAAAPTASAFSRRLLPLNALKAFEVAGRHLNFTAAAEELSVTLSAISHQIRQLEEMLGVPLFHRTRRGLVLSPEGQAILPDVQRGFDYLAQALAKLEARRTEGTLTISMFSTVAMRWFIPRLSRFQAKHPDIDVRITTSMKPIDLEREGLDCAIRYGNGDWPGLTATKLFTEELAVVAHPDLAGKIHKPADLAGLRLLHSQNRIEHWRIWLQAMGANDIDPTVGPVFETRSFTIQAALQGLGVAVMDPAFVAEEIKAGRLVRLFDRSFPVSGAYWLVCLDHMAEAPRIKAMRDWLLEETAS